MNIEDDMWVQLFNLLDEYPGLVPGDVGGEWLAAQDVESLEADYGWTANGSGSGVRFAE